jgi:outer membrane lipoprotein LolB
MWSGRLSLQVESEPPQSFSATYELRGNAEQGELALFTPLGSTVAVLAWTPEGATLRADNRTRQFESLDALAQHVTGTAVPVAALFGWLRGEGADAVPGWHAELSQLERGRLSARRTSPLPEAVLHMVIDR